MGWWCGVEAGPSAGLVAVGGGADGVVAVPLVVGDAELGGEVLVEVVEGDALGGELALELADQGVGGNPRSDQFAGCGAVGGHGATAWRSASARARWVRIR